MLQCTRRPTHRYDFFLAAAFIWHGCCPGQCEAIKLRSGAEWEPSTCFTSKTEFPTGGRLKSRAAAVTGAVRTMARAAHQTPLQQHKETSSIQWESIEHRNVEARGFTDKQNKTCSRFQARRLCRAVWNYETYFHGNRRADRNNDHHKWMSEQLHRSHNCDFNLMWFGAACSPRGFASNSE